MQVSEDDKSEASEKRSAGVMAMNEGELKSSLMIVKTF